MPPSVQVLRYYFSIASWRLIRYLISGWGPVYCMRVVIIPGGYCVPFGQRAVGRSNLAAASGRTHPARFFSLFLPLPLPLLRESTELLPSSVVLSSLWLMLQIDGPSLLSGDSFQSSQGPPCLHMNWSLCVMESLSC